MQVSDRRRSKPVMVDVARLAGVSQKTVSRVVNDEPNVSQAARIRVQRAIDELGFLPNAAARALVSQRTGTLGILAPATSLYGPATQLLCLEQAAWEVGHSVTIASVREGGQAELSDAIDRLLLAGADGLLIGSSVLTEHIRELDLRGVPAVTIGDPTDLGIPAIVTDQAAGVVAVVDHLLGLGHQTVHLLSGPRIWQAAIAREQAWREAVSAAGAPVPEPLEGDWTARSGYELGLRLATDPSVTAVFAANDHMAIGVLRALAESGRRVPDDVSLVGFDDAPEAAYLPVPLTTVRQDFVGTTRTAVAQLVRLISGQTVESQIASTPELVVRNSTASAPARP